MAGSKWKEKKKWQEAEALHHDSIFAYRLQMKEAIAASIVSAPSSSSSSYAPQPSDFYDSIEDYNLTFSEDLNLQMEEIAMLDQIRSDEESAYYDSIEEDNLAISEAFTLQMEEIAMFDQIRSDEEFARAEMLKEHDNLSRRVFQQDDVCFKNMFAYGGRNPHCCSSPLSESKCFRLYFKGVSKEETVNESVIRFFGAGIAICEPDNDNPILEIRKPLHGGDIVQETVDFVALIECLNAALILDLKRVVVLCDDILTHLCIIGKKQNLNQNITILTQKAIRLSKIFAKCTFSLVPASSIQNVYKLSSEAIASQLRTTLESGVVKNPVCTICLEEVESKMMFTVDVCRHKYCIPCLKQHVVSQLYQARVPGCPHQGCKTLFSPDSCKPLLTPQLSDLMAFRIREFSIPASEKIYCPYPRCSALMLASDVLENSKQLLSGGGGTFAVVEYMKAGASKCVKCGNYFCIFCKSVWHRGMSCSEYKSSNMYLSTEDSKLKSLATQNLWRQCVMCKNMIERTRGCNHITCRCGYEFCYLCGCKWKTCHH